MIPDWLQRAQGGLLGTPDNYGGLLADQELQRARQQGLQSFGASLLQASGPTRMPTSFGQALGGAVQAGQQGQQVSTQQALQNLLLKKQLTAPNYEKMGPGDVLIDKNNPATPIYSAAPKTDPKNEMGKLNADHQAGLVSDEDYATLKSQMLAGTPDKSLVGTVSPGEFTGASLEKYKQSGNYADLVRQYAPNTQMLATNMLQGNDLDTAAESYRVTGKVPQGMSRSPATTAAIMHRAAELAAANGDDAHATVIGQQANKAAQAGLSKIVQQQTLVGAFEKTASKNADLALQLSEKVDRSGVPLFNRYALAGKKAIAGDVDTARFQAANDTFVNEYAKVMSGSTGSTAVSDSARAHAHEMLNTAQTKDQYSGVVSLLKQEMGNRMDSFEQQKAELAPAIGSTHETPTAKTTVAPQAAIDHLKAHPELKGQFKAKYGYLPDGQ